MSSTVSPPFGRVAPVFSLKAERSWEVGALMGK